MTISTLESLRTPARESVCPQCGRSVHSPTRPSIAEAGLTVLAAVILAVMLVPLGIMAWKACSEFLSDSFSNSILFHPLEDWTRY